MGPEAGRPLTRAIAPASLLVLLIGAALLFAAPRIQSDIETRSNAALASAGYGALQASADGRDVTLSGSLGEGVSLDAPLAIVAALPGVRSAAAQQGPVGSGSAGLAAPAAYRFGAAWDGRTLTLTGYLPTRDARESTVTHARDVLRGVEVEDRTEAAPGAPDGNWPLIAAAGIAAMQKLASATLEMNGTSVTFTGIARNATDYNEATRILDSLPTPYTAAADIRVNPDAPPPPPAPYRFSAAHDGSGTALAGSVPSAEVARLFADTLKGAMPDAAVDDRSKPSAGAPDGAWGDAVALTLAALAPAQGATLVVEGRTLAVDAMVRNEAGRETMLASFAELPAGYVLTLRVSVEGAATAEENRFGSADDPAAQCQADFNAALSASPLAFATDGTLAAESAPTISRLAAIAATCPNARLEIAAHTDASGKAAASAKLSDARARAVAEALSAKGIESGRIAALGYGGARPIASNEDDAGRARNDRIEVIVRR